MDATQPTLEPAWNAWQNLVADRPLLVLAGVTAIIVLLGLGVWLTRRSQRVIIVPEARADLVRQPKYLDTAVLSDIHAHVEAEDHGRSLRNVLEYQESTDEARAVALRSEQVRMLNKSLAASRRRTDLAHVLDEHTDGLPEVGSVIEARGTLAILPASRASALVVQAQQMLSPTWSPSANLANDDGVEGALLTRDATPTILDDEQPPVIIGIDTIHGRLVAVLDQRSMLDSLRDGEVVSVLAVLDRPITRRDPARVEQYLPDHLSANLRDALRDRDVLEVAEHLAKATGRDFKPRKTVERGPGAMIRTAAIW